MDLLLQIRYKGLNYKEDELERFIDILFNTIAKENYIKIRNFIYVTCAIIIIVNIYAVWSISSIILWVILIIGILFILYLLLNLKKVFRKSLGNTYKENFLDRDFILNFYEDAIEIKFDDENSIKLVYHWIENVYETVDMFLITDITWIFKSQLSKEEITAIKDILKSKFADKYTEFN